MYFSSMTITEYLGLNQAIIPAELANYMEALLVQINSQQQEIARLERSNEVISEQLSFGRELVRNLDDYCERNLSKAKMVGYQRLRDDTQFEI